MTLPRYIAEAKDLLQSFHPQTNAPRHHEILTSIARRYGAKDWHALLARRTFLQALAACFKKHRPIEHPTLDALLYQPAPLDSLCFGLSSDRNQLFNIEDSWLRRHMLLLGSQGMGMSVLIEHLLAQQLVRGGGFLYVDPYQDKRLQAHLAHVARAVRAPLVYCTEQSAATNLNLGSMMSAQAGLIVSLPLLLEPEKAQTTMQAIKAQLKVQVAELLGGPKPRRDAPPVLMVIPCAHLFHGIDLEILLSQARAAGIAFVFADSSIENLDCVAPGTAASLLQNTWTKVLFRNNSAKATAQASELVTRCSSERLTPLNPTNREIAEKLLHLGLGDALVFNAGTLEHIHVQMLRLENE